MTTNVALIGYGYAGRHIWAPRLSGRTDARCVAVVDPDVEALREAESDLPGVYTSMHISQLDQIDAAIVCVPPAEHHRTVMELLALGKHVLVEKPFVLRPQHAVDAWHAAGQAGVQLMVVAPARYRSDVRQLSEIVRGLGRPITVQASWKRGGGIPRPGSWLTNHDAGGGAWMDLGPHLLDAVGTVVGADTALTVKSVVGSRGRPDTGAADWLPTAEPRERFPRDAEERCLVVACLATGTAVEIEVDWDAPVELDETTIRVTSEDWSATLVTTFGFSPRRVPCSLTVTRGNADVRCHTPASVVGAEYSRQLEAFLRSLSTPDASPFDANTRPLRPTAAMADSLWTIRALLGAREHLRPMPTP